MTVLAFIVGIFLVGGLFVFFSAAIGMIRFPDFYSRLHPAGMIDSMGVLLSMAGLSIYTLFYDGVSLSSFLSFLKIVLIVMFLFITSPTATHAIVDAGMRAGLQPWTKKKETPGS